MAKIEKKAEGFYYVASPLNAPTAEGIRQNMYFAKKYARRVTELTGMRAIAPHSVLPELVDDNIPEERELALDFGLGLIKISKGIVVCGNRISNGMKAEIALAEELGLDLFYLEDSSSTTLRPAKSGEYIEWMMSQKREVV